MKLDQIHPSLQVALGFHEALRRLGFPAGGIYLHLKDGQLSVAVMNQEKVPCVLPSGEYAGTQEQLLEEWGRVAAAYNGGEVSSEDAYRCVCMAVPEGKVMEFAASLLRAGVRIPGKTSN